MPKGWQLHSVNSVSPPVPLHVNFACGRADETVALAAFARGGFLACTSYFDREHELLKAAVTTRGAELRWDARHHGSRPLHDAPGKSVDRHLALFGIPA